ncbi:UDP-glucose 4-epimerase GalE [Comamonas terrigena]|uniref:UDP-glucose 4-epimerase GalE n=1 Tax=Comamonas terrigena TaxID=32013 RepID=UPI0023556BA7|nr:UDP-glucose 4-epimerase GalE [Comamonas terrigena]MDH0047927.1 UDP-glucose 4-epimerase GalE [Comamonas terrigena]MDH0510473.1 UDP-glucose 4-epimerase GalE [Comamonas terrigena]MDH1090075.1 UDP-glucose 4-epimerase GalE [Comamonas terrigena]MDH1290154.1 UDP-glucose 4-epimerase GalE [Comamonas terrigena]MDH1499947.1 UDP-glucose 4-epimerase GalE [Comamonas terrigena]
MILITGGAGFIGSHTCVALAACSEPFLILDHFGNSRRSVLERMGRITGMVPPCIEGDIRDAGLLRRIFAQYPITEVIHFAALKSVGESVREALRYYDNNIAGTVTLLQAMRAANVRSMVFSSSATVYGDPASLPIREDFPLSATNPYGQTKLMMEQVLADTSASEPGQWRIARLRYFNPVGAHESGLIGEDPQDVPNNLMPYVAQVAAGQRPCLSVFGNDYPTPDGTGTRDYIHVMDLAAGHVAALRYLRQNMGLLTVNLGTGRPVSVLEMVRSFEKASGRPVPYAVVARRPGDVAQCWADPGLAERLLGWKAELDVDRMCADAWRWQNGVGRSLLEESALAAH